MANDTIIQDGMLVYRGILETTRDVFGDKNMTEEVIRTAVTEAGNMAWKAMTLAEPDKDGE